MVQRFAPIKETKFIFLILLLFSLITADNIQLNLGDQKISNEYKDVNNVQYFKIIPELESILKNYVKVIIEEGNEGSNHKNHVLSYYQQDSTFKERKQLSQNINGITVMWLTKEQTKSEFYLSVECSTFPCSYKMNIIPIDEAVLYLNEQYTYYVTKENKDIKFKIIGNIEETDEVKQYTISIWAKGDKELSSKLEKANSYQKHSKYNAYYISTSSLANEQEFDFTVNAKEGDLINIGSLNYEGNTLTFPIKDNGMEFSGFLNKNNEKNCYKISSNSNHKPFTFIDHEKNNVKLTAEFSNDGTDNYMCLSLPEEYDELFFTAYYSPNNKNDGKGMNKFSPLSLGLTLETFIDEGEAIALIPKITNEDYNFLTYHVNPKIGKVNMYIYKCDNYPLCQVNSEIIKNSNFIPSFHSSSKSFKKNEMNNISPISKTQNILILKCEKGLKIVKDSSYNTCINLVNMFTDKNSVLLDAVSLYYNHILKDNEDNYYISNPLKYLNPSIDNINLNIEVLSGKISIKVNNEEMKPYVYDNKYLYEIILKDVYEFNIKIKAEKNSIYDISYSTGRRNDKTFSSHLYSNGANYLINLDHDIKDMILITNYYNDYNISDEYYTSFYPINCKINAENYNHNSDKYLIEEKNNIYQHIINFAPIYDHYLYYFVKKNESIKEPNLYYLSSFIYKGIESLHEEGIYLSNGIPHSFIFNQENNKIKYLFPYIEYDQNVNIISNINNNGNYKMEVFINENSVNNYEIKENKNITIDKESIKSKCPNTELICIISFNIESLKNTDETILEITSVLGAVESPSKNDISPASEKGFWGKYKLLIIIGAVVLVLLIVIIVVVIFIFWKKNKDLGKDVNTISFTDEQKGEEDEDQLLS